jgi:hypothetical protein
LDLILDHASAHRYGALVSQVALQEEDIHAADVLRRKRTPTVQWFRASIVHQKYTHVYIVELRYLLIDLLTQ